MLAIFQHSHVLGRALDEPLLDRVSALLVGKTRCAAAAGQVYAERPRLADDLRAGEFEFLRTAAVSCSASRSPDAAEALALDAVAKAYDPHSAFVPAAEARRLSDAPAARARGRIVEYAGERIAVIVLPSFYLRQAGRSASADVRFLVQQLRAASPSALLLDLRGNGGGVVAEAMRLSAALVGSGPMGYTLAKGDERETLSAASEPLAWSGPLVVQVDSSTASVSELFASAVQDRGRGLIIGERTYGKGTRQSLVWLSSPLGAAAAAVWVSDRFFYRLDGRALQQRGVTPDIELPSPAHTGKTERELEAALHARDLRRFASELVHPLSVELLNRLRAQQSEHDPELTAYALTRAFAHADGD